MTDKIGYLVTKDRSYPICMNINVVEDIQNKYGSIPKWGEVVANKDSDVINIKDLKIGVLLMINEAIDIENSKKAPEERVPFVNERELGRILTEVGLDNAKNIIFDLAKESNSTEDNQKNV